MKKKRARPDRERGREKESERERVRAGENIGEGKSGTYDEVTPIFFKVDVSYKRVHVSNTQ